MVQSLSNNQKRNECVRNNHFTNGVPNNHFRGGECNSDSLFSVGVLKECTMINGEPGIQTYDLLTGDKEFYHYI